ncbi:rod shape-determining protein, partial [Klebsiella pneumoniae]|nr:rod shape-determining protein [Klebsiella pneumoniae]
PIAAINVLIPTTMRHLNLVLIDVGAGTSDVAITRDGSVIAYGMVPFAGDEITEAISQQFLLDFNVAETVKRQSSGKNKKISFTDVLGMSQKV